MSDKMKMRQSIKDDEYWTPSGLYQDLCNKYDIDPILDVAANEYNCKTFYYLEDALHEEWLIEDNQIVSVWCNPPHSLNSEFVARAEVQHLRYGMDIMMIIPANFGGTKTFHRYIEGKREYHFVEGRPRFLKDGVLSEYPSRNAYIIILWRKNP